MKDINGNPCTGYGQCTNMWQG